MAQWLNLAIALLRQIVAFDIELQCAAKGDVEYLEPFANGEDRQTARERFHYGCELPTVALRIGLFVQQRRIQNFLVQEFRRNIRAACEQQTVHSIERNIANPRIPDFDLRMASENRAKPFRIFRTHPRGQIWHKDYFFRQITSSLFRLSINASTLPVSFVRKRMRPSTPLRKKMSHASGESSSRLPFRLTTNLSPCRVTVRVCPGASS